MYISLHVKCFLLFSEFNETWIFSTYCRKMLKDQISWQSVWWEPSCSTWTDRQTDMMKLIATFCNFVNTPEKCFFSAKCPDKLSSLLLHSYWWFCLQWRGQGRKQTTYIHLVLRLRICGAIPLFLRHAFMACTGTTLHLLMYQQMQVAKE